MEDSRLQCLQSVDVLRWISSGQTIDIPSRPFSSYSQVPHSGPFCRGQVPRSHLLEATGEMTGARAALLILLGLVLMSQEVNSRAGRGHNMGSVLLYYML